MLTETPTATPATTVAPRAQLARTASPQEAEQVVSLLTLAFAADPAARWVFPAPHVYAAYWPEFVRAFGGRAFEHSTAFMTEDSAGNGATGAALWLPPGVQPDEEALVALVKRSAAERTQGELFAVLEQMAGYHPSVPHWYLPLIGVDPPEQGHGYGSALLAHALARCDREGIPAYLESSNQKNVPLYERHGFEVLGTIQVGQSPPLWPMLRSPQSGNPRAAEA